MELTTLTSHAMFGNGEPKLKRPALGWRLSLCEQAGAGGGSRALDLFLISPLLSSVPFTLHFILCCPSYVKRGSGKVTARFLINRIDSWHMNSASLCAHFDSSHVQRSTEREIHGFVKLFSKQYQISPNHAPPSLADLCICRDVKKSCQNSMFQDQLTPG